MRKIDFRKELKYLYNPSVKEVIIVDVPKMNFLMIDGRGDPNNSKEFKVAIEALYGMSYVIKFILKHAKKGNEYIVPPLEGLWWVDNNAVFDMEDRKNWKWTLMIMQPQFVTSSYIAKAFEKINKKKPGIDFSKIRFESFHEGPSAQIMHIGSYSAEEPVIKKMQEFIKKNGYELSGKHHEIYLSDPRKSVPEKMKTVLRQPIKKVA